MKVTIKLDTDFEVEAEIPDEIIDRMKKEKELKTIKKTGYERAEPYKFYYCANAMSIIEDVVEQSEAYDDRVYELANYYTSRTLAENNSLADALMRRMRRFAVEHRQDQLRWNSGNQDKFYIYYSCTENKLCVGSNYIDHTYGTVYFDTRTTAQLAIDTFKDELMWYFIEYKDSI